MKRWLTIAVLTLFGVVPLLLLGAAAWLASTESGTRFLMARIQPYLPAELSLNDVSGTLTDRLRVGELVWDSDAVRVVVTAIEVEPDLGRVLDRVLVLDRLEVGSVDIETRPTDDARDTGWSRPSFRVSLPLRLTVRSAAIGPVRLSGADGETTTIAEQTALAGQWRGTRVSVDRLVVEAPGYAATAAARLTLAPPYRVDAKVNWALAAIANDPLHGRATVVGNVDGYRVVHSLGGAYRIDSRGRVSAGDEPQLDLSHRWSSIALPLGERLSLGAGTLTTRGSFASVAFELQTDAVAETVGDLDVTASGRAALDRIVVESLSLGAESFGLDADGRLVVDADGVRWNLAIDARDVDLALLDSRLASSITLDGDSGGSFGPERKLVASLSIAELNGRFRERLVSGQGELAWSGEALSAEDFELRVGTNRVTINGEAGQRELGLDVDIDAPALDQLWPTLGGRIGGRATLGGRWPVPSIDADLAAESLRLPGLEAERVAVRASSNGETDQTLRLDASAVVIAGNTIDRAELDWTGDLDAHELDLSVSALGLDASLAARGSLTLDPQSWSGSLTALTVGADGVAPWTLDQPSQLSLSAEQQRIEPLCLAGPDGGQLCLDIDAKPKTRDVVAKVRVIAIPIAPWLATRVPDIVVNGGLDADVDLSWRDGRLDGIGGIELRDADFALIDPDGTIGDPIPVRLSLSGQIDGGRLEAGADIRLANAGTGRVELTVDDVLNRASPLDGSVVFDLSDVTFLSVFIPGVQVRAGTLSADVRVAGTLAEPNVSGSATLDGGSALVDASGTSIRDLSVTIVPENNERLRYRGSASVGDGTLEFSGETRIDRAARWQTSVAIRGNRAELIRLPDWSVTASPDLTVDYAERRFTVRGRIAVPAATVTLEDLPDQAVTASSDAVIHVEGQDREQALGYRLDVVVEAGDEVRLTGFGLETRLTGRLALSGGSERGVRGTGALTLVDGRFEAYGQELTIERGRLNFTGSLTNPLLDFRAIRVVDDVRVGLAMAGTAQNPRSTIFSDPPMTEANALSYLLTGRPLSAAGGGDGSLLNSAALALGLSQAGKVAAEISASLGLDELGIEGGGEDGRLLAGKWLGDNLYLQYAFGIFDRLGSLLVRFRLSERLVLETRSGREQSLDLVYSVGRD